MMTSRLLGTAIAVNTLVAVVPGARTAFAVAFTSAHRVRQAEGVVDRGGRSSLTYWTVGRVVRATPMTAPGVGHAAEPPAGIMSARPGGGSKVVGALFFNDRAGDHYCTASVIRTHKRNLLLTAAHCLYNPRRHRWNTHIVFVPKYSRGHRPYGTWPVWMMLTDKRWIDHGDPDLDFGFAAVQGMRGRHIADVVGANTLGRGAAGRVTVIGYPAKTNHRPDRPVWCAPSTRRQARYQVAFDCQGFSGGSSGSPWLTGYDNRTQSGRVVGVIGGYQQGGAYAWRSYSAIFDDDVAHLMTAADRRA